MKRYYKVTGWTTKGTLARHYFETPSDNPFPLAQEICHKYT